jgi:hypothetical protein
MTLLLYPTVVSDGASRCVGGPCCWLVMPHACMPCPAVLQVECSNARAALIKDPEGARFPWRGEADSRWGGGQGSIFGGAGR